MGHTEPTTIAASGPWPSEAAAGESGAWSRWLPRAWTAVADHHGAHPPPPLPTRMGGRRNAEERDPRTSQAGGTHEDLLAYWVPLLHLLVFGLGWVRPDLGLERWIQQGRPTQDPVLAVVERWWGPHVEDLLAWASDPIPLQQHVASVVAQEVRTKQPSTVRVSDRWQRRRADPNWQAVWGGGWDAMHLTRHFAVPLWGSTSDSTHQLIVGPEADRRAVLICDSYAGWFAALASCGLSTTSTGRSWQVDVVVRPLGWLGTYRRSRETAMWFSGRHRWHTMGW